MLPSVNVYQLAVSTRPIQSCQMNSGWWCKKPAQFTSTSPCHTGPFFVRQPLFRLHAEPSNREGASSSRADTYRTCVARVERAKEHKFWHSFDQGDFDGLFLSFLPKRAAKMRSAHTWLSCVLISCFALYGHQKLLGYIRRVVKR